MEPKVVSELPPDEKEADLSDHKILNTREPSFFHYLNTALQHLVSVKESKQYKSKDKTITNDKKMYIHLPYVLLVKNNYVKNFLYESQDLNRIPTTRRTIPIKRAKSTEKSMKRNHEPEIRNKQERIIKKNKLRNIKFDEVPQILETITKTKIMYGCNICDKVFFKCWEYEQHKLWHIKPEVLKVEVEQLDLQLIDLKLKSKKNNIKIISNNVIDNILDKYLSKSTISIQKDPVHKIEGPDLTVGETIPSTSYPNSMNEDKNIIPNKTTDFGDYDSDKTSIIDLLNILEDDIASEEMKGNSEINVSENTKVAKDTDLNNSDANESETRLSLKRKIITTLDNTDTNVAIVHIKRTKFSNDKKTNNEVDNIEIDDVIIDRDSVKDTTVMLSTDNDSNNTIIIDNTSPKDTANKLCNSLDENINSDTEKEVIIDDNSVEVTAIIHSDYQDKNIGNDSEQHKIIDGGSVEDIASTINTDKINPVLVVTCIKNKSTYIKTNESENGQGCN